MMNGYKRKQDRYDFVNRYSSYYTATDRHTLTHIDIQRNPHVYVYYNIFTNICRSCRCSHWHLILIDMLLILLDLNENWILKTFISARINISRVPDIEKLPNPNLYNVYVFDWIVPWRIMACINCNRFACCFFPFPFLSSIFFSKLN